MTNNKITFEQATDAFDIMRSAMAAVGYILLKWA